MMDFKTAIKYKVIISLNSKLIIQEYLLMRWSCQFIKTSRTF